MGQKGKHMSKRFIPCYGSLCLRPYLPPDQQRVEGPLTGDIRFHEVSSKILRGTREIVVYLPPGYAAEAQWDYPYALLHDGQNIFDSRSAVFGVEWGVDETAERLITDQEIKPVILVAIYNTPQRINEYTPFPDADHGGGKAELYKAFILRELIPFLEDRYTLSKRTEERAVIGSSLGALASLYLGWSSPDTFGYIGALSPSLWWGCRGFITAIGGGPTPLSRPRIWLDAGTSETDTDRNQNGVPDLLDDLRTFRAVLLNHGYRLDDDLAYREIEGATHDEKSWSGRIADVLKFMFGKPSRPI